MKVNIEELQVKRANNRYDVENMRIKHGCEMDRITYDSFHQYVPFNMADGALVILHNEKPVAMCIYAGRTIYGVCTDEEYRNNGICHMLMKECINDMTEILKKRGEDCIRLFSNNPVAQKIYEEVGFVYEHGCNNKYYKLNI